MMTLKSKILIIAHSIYLMPVFAGNYQTDSLLQVLQTVRTDSQRAVVLTSLCREFTPLDLNKALEYGMEAVDLCRRLGLHSALGDAHIFLGLAYYTQGNLDKARWHYFKSYALRNEMNDIKGIAAVLNNIGLLYYKENELDKAIEYLEKSAHYAVKSGGDMNVLKAVCKNLSELYNRIRDYRSAWKYDRMYAHIQDSLLKVEKKKRMTELEVMYENEKKQREIERLQARQLLKESALRRQRQVFIAVLSGLLLTVALLLLLYRGYRQKQYANKLLRERNDMITTQRDELEKLSVVAEKTNAGVVISRPDGKFLWVNKGFERMTGYTFKEFCAQCGNSISEVSTNKKIAEELNALQRNGCTLRYESYHYHKNGQLVWTSVTHTPVTDPQGRLIKIVSVYNNITELKKAEESIRKKNRDITDSLEYASALQQSMLPDAELLKSCFSDHFILNKPRDIVSGDFYWFHRKNNTLYVAAADCTGHGVPGAFVSLIGMKILNDLMSRDDLHAPGDILTELNREVVKVFREDEQTSDIRDGMDITLLAITPQADAIRFAGAMNPLLVWSGNALNVHAVDRHSIGSKTKTDQQFTTFSAAVRSGDMLYLFSDGYADQFGGPAGRQAGGKKLLMKNFKNKLLESAPLSAKEQKTFLLNYLSQWQGDEPQVDDILVLGLRI